MEPDKDSGTRSRAGGDWSPVLNNVSRVCPNKKGRDTRRQRRAFVMASPNVPILGRYILRFCNAAVSQGSSGFQPLSRHIEKKKKHLAPT